MLVTKEPRGGEWERMRCPGCEAIEAWCVPLSSSTCPLILLTIGHVTRDELQELLHIMGNSPESVTVEKVLSTFDSVVARANRQQSEYSKPIVSIALKFLPGEFFWS